MSHFLREKRLYAWLKWLLVGLLASTLVGSLGGRIWYLGIFAHFKLHYLLALVAGLILWAPTRRWGWIMVGVLAIGLNLADILPLYHEHDRAVSSATPGSTRLRLVSANLLRSNESYAAITDYLLAEAPDVVILLETTSAMQAGLQPLIEQYPYRRIEAREGYFGLMLLSRFPLIQSQVLYLCEAEVPTIHATLFVAGQPMQVIATHPPAPPKPIETKLRNQQLEGLARLAATLPPPILLAGDLNLTSYHPAFGELLSQSGLYDSRRGFGIQATWPVRLGPLGISLDHCLLSPDIHVLSREVGPNVGSDHAPIALDLMIPGETFVSACDSP
jgi:endonuclease/exonuclease/phosphatase (EEP) superfamily protein YafD